MSITINYHNSTLNTVYNTLFQIRNVANTVALLVSNSNKDSLATCDNTDKVSILATMDMLVDSMASGRLYYTESLLL